MKNYHEMVQWLVDQVDSGQLRYNEGPAAMAIAMAYGIPQRTVVDDVKFEKDFRDRAKKKQRRAEYNASNEQRRLANLVKSSETTIGQELAQSSDNSWVANPDRMGGSFTQDEVNEVEAWK